MRLAEHGPPPGQPSHVTYMRPAASTSADARANVRIAGIDAVERGGHADGRRERGSAIRRSRGGELAARVEARVGEGRVDDDERAVRKDERLRAVEADSSPGTGELAAGVLQVRPPSSENVVRISPEPTWKYER